MPPKRPSVIVDPTLSLAGEAADAAVTGQYVRTSQADIVVIKAQIEEIQAQGTALQEDLNKLREDFEKSEGDIKADIEALKKKDEELQKKLTCVCEKVNDLKSNFDTAIAEIDERFDEDEQAALNRIEVEDKRFYDDEQLISQNRADIAALKEIAKAVEISIKDIYSRLEKAEEDIDSLQKSCEIVRDKLEVIDSRLDQHDDRLEEIDDILNNEETGLIKRIQDLEQSCEIIKEKVFKNEADIQELFNKSIFGIKVGDNLLEKDADNIVTIDAIDCGDLEEAGL